jgi:MG2 domain/Macroglobulin domain MG3
LEVVSLSSSAESAFYEKQFLYVEAETFSILIQTNKASYRSAEMCKYRILIFDSETRPVDIISSLTISIYDSSKNMVHQKIKQNAKKGVYSGEYQIPARGKTGDWQIEAEYKDKRIRKQFEVTKTERPNFQIIARTPNLVSNNSTQFSVGVECYYSFGKPITGTAVIKATPILKSNNSWTETAKPVTITKDVRGTYLATFLMSDFKIPKVRTCDSILIETTVQEKATGRVVRGHDKTIPMDYQKIPSKYDILLYYFGFFLASQMYSIKVHINAKSGVALPTAMQSVKFAVAFDSELTEASTYTTYELDANGKTEIMVQVPPNAKSKINFRVMHGESNEEVTVLAKKLHVQTINSVT